MKKISIVAALFLASATVMVAMSRSANQRQCKLEQARTTWTNEIRELADMRTEASQFKTKLDDQKEMNLPAQAVAGVGIGPRLGAYLQTNDIRHTPSQLQDQMLASLGSRQISSRSYVLVSKAALAGAHLHPLKSYPNNDKLTDAVRDVLAITPEEQKVVEMSFANAYAALGAWARDHVQREGSANQVVVQYAIPADATFRESWTRDLFSNIRMAIGEERANLLRKDFDIHALTEDAAIGDRTNILSIERIAGPPGYGYRAGWRWANHSEAINTVPEPIRTNNFPLAFRFVFPGGWQELAQREGIELSQ